MIIKKFVAATLAISCVTGLGFASTPPLSVEKANCIKKVQSSSFKIDKTLGTLNNPFAHISKEFNNLPQMEREIAQISNILSDNTPELEKASIYALLLSNSIISNKLELHSSPSVGLYVMGANRNIALLTVDQVNLSDSEGLRLNLGVEPTQVFTIKGLKYDVCKNIQNESANDKDKPPSPLDGENQVTDIVSPPKDVIPEDYEHLLTPITVGSGNVIRGEPTNSSAASNNQGNDIASACKLDVKCTVDKESSE